MLSRLVVSTFAASLMGLGASLVFGAKDTGLLWRYYWDTIEACVPPEQVLATLESVGFLGVRRHIETKALSILAEYQASKPG